jgi:DNA-binding NarL/FixJ family response regulator
MDLVEMLQEAGYEVIAQATNGEEAIALALLSLAGTVQLASRGKRGNGAAVRQDILKKKKST